MVISLVVVWCPSLAGVDSGSVIMTTDGTSTQAVYSCVSGYRLMQQSTLTCLNTGQWDQSQPTCGELIRIMELQATYNLVFQS